MLTDRFPPDTLRLLPLGEWRPHPTIGDRVAWAAVPAQVAATCRHQADRAATLGWPALSALRYLDFHRVGNRRRYEEPYFERRVRLTDLVTAECLEDRGERLDAIVEGVWAIAEESSWCLPAHIGMQTAGTGLPDTGEPSVDLFAADTASALAWTLYLLEDRLDTVSPLVAGRLRREIATRVIDPVLARDDFWWMGLGPNPQRLNNWTPWVVSNLLAAGLLTEADPARRKTVVTRGMLFLDRFLDPYPRDGGCDEGPGYWSRAAGSLFDCLEILYGVTGGRIDLWSDPLVRSMGRYITGAQIWEDWFLCFADASAIVHPPAGLVFAYGRRIGDTAMEELGAWLMARRDAATRYGAPEGLQRHVREIHHAAAASQARARQPLPRDTWLGAIEVLATRDTEGSGRGWYLAAKGGHNAESHNHNDIGSFVVYRDGRPLLVDAGVGEYTRATFSQDRYKLWTMVSPYHNLLPALDGVEQAPGAGYRARDVTAVIGETSATLEMEIAGAYPEGCGLASWRRRVELTRGRGVTVVDRWRLDLGIQAITLSLLTPCRPRLRAETGVRLRPVRLPAGRVTAGGWVRFEVLGGRSPAVITAQPIELTDSRLSPVWGPRLWRLVIRIEHPAAEGGLETTVTEVWPWKRP